MAQKTEKCTILGAGSWGTALGFLLRSNNYPVTFWTYEEKVVDELNNSYCNSKYLPGVDILPPVKATSDLEAALKNASFIILALPSHVIRSFCRDRLFHAIKKQSFSTDDITLINAAKGLEEKSQKRMSEVIIEEFPGYKKSFGVISGPSHAEEVGRGIPTTVVASGFNPEPVSKIQNILMNSSFRVYINPDLLGVELGGALKNVIAIASGVASGLGYGDNAKAALITRGVAEIARLGIAMGAEPITFAGLSGLGDLVVTCTSEYSRNFQLGKKIGQGNNPQKATSEMIMIAEGFRTTKAAFNLSQKHEIEMPITNEIFKILYEEKDPEKSTTELMQRTPKHEMEHYPFFSTEFNNENKNNF